MQLIADVCLSMACLYSAPYELEADSVTEMQTWVTLLNRATASGGTGSADYAQAYQSIAIEEAAPDGWNIVEVENDGRRCQPLHGADDRSRPRAGTTVSEVFRLAEHIANDGALGASFDGTVRRDFTEPDAPVVPVRCACTIVLGRFCLCCCMSACNASIMVHGSCLVSVTVFVDVALEMRSSPGHSVRAYTIPSQKSPTASNPHMTTPFHYYMAVL